MVDYGATNHEKSTKIKLSEKGMIFELHQKARKNQTLSLVDRITNVKNDILSVYFHSPA